MGNLRLSRKPGRVVFILFFFVLVSPTGFSQTDPVIAVLPFEVIDGPEENAPFVYTFFETSLVETAVYRVMSEQERDRILQEAGKFPVECRDSECAVQIGKKLSAEQVVLGSVAQVGEEYIINAKIIEVARSRPLAADSIRAAESSALAGACRQLVRELVGRAMPGSLVEPEPERPETAEAGVPRAEVAEAAEREQPETAAPTAEEAGAEQQEPGLEPGKKRRLALTKADVWPLVTICGGMFLLEVGNAAASAGFELRRRTSDAYLEYEQTSWNFDELYKSYNSAYNGYIFSTVLSYVSWSVALASIPTYIYVFPDRAFRLSRWGKIAFTSGAALSIAGNVLDFLACSQRYRTDFLLEDYNAAGTGHDEPWDKYQKGYTLYSVERLSSYAFWLIGGGAMIGAFFIPGEREQLIEGFWEKTSLVGGISLIGLGSLTRTLALNFRQTYVEGGGSDEKAYDRYVLYSVLSYGFWAVGGTGMLLPFFTDLGGGGRHPGGRHPGDREAQPEPLSLERLRLLPLPNGLLLQISL
jgi:TolB-like protein